MAIVDRRTCPPFKTPESYLKKKLNILENQFMIHPTEEQRKHLSALTTQTEINNAIWRIMDAYYDTH